MNQTDLIKHAKSLMAKKDFENALKPLLSIDEKGISKEVAGGKYILLSMCYYNMEKNQQAMDWGTKALLLDKTNEFASILKCNIYFQMKRFDKAYEEMESFLKDNEPHIYLVILVKFTKAISDGQITDADLISKIYALEDEINTA